VADALSKEKVADEGRELFFYRSRIFVAFDEWYNGS